MGFGADLFSIASTFCSSIFDIGSDLINSLDFLGHNVSTTMTDGLSRFIHLRHNLTPVDMFDETSKAGSQEIYDVHQIWGALEILIMFIPGVIDIP